MDGTATRNETVVEAFPKREALVLGAFDAEVQRRFGPDARRPVRKAAVLQRGPRVFGRHDVSSYKRQAREITQVLEERNVQHEQRLEQ